MRVGILTAGGDCPGLNAVIRAIVLKGIRIHGHEFIGFKDGWRGLVESDYININNNTVRGISKQGGTILGTSRVSPYQQNSGADKIKQNLSELKVEAVIAIGGEGTLAAAKRLADEGIHIVGVPKTIDNDLYATDYTFGFDTAVSIATESIDRLRTTAESHHRCMIVEVMGRHAGWIALHAGMASGAHAILIPEQKISIKQIIEWVESVNSRSRSPLVVVSEGFEPCDIKPDYNLRGLDGFGRQRLGGIGEWLASKLEQETGIESRAATLGHLQRGGVPTAFDRVLSTRLGMAAIDTVHDKEWAKMVALRGTEIVRVSFEEATIGLKAVPNERFEEAAILFG